MEALFVSKWATWEKSLQTGVGLTNKTDKTDSACMEKSLQTGVGLTDKIDKTDSEAMPRAMAQMPCPCVVCGGCVRWHDHGILRCHPCWPMPLTQHALALPPVEMAPEPEAPVEVAPEPARRWSLGALRDALRVAMGQGLRLHRVRGKYRIDDPQHVLPAGARTRRLAREPFQRLLEECAMQGPILPACEVCGGMVYWRDHTTDVWECWGCVPPVL